MKIKYNLEYNYFDLYNEAQGIINFKKDLYKNEYTNIKSYIQHGLLLIKIMGVFLLLMIIMTFINKASILAYIIDGLFALSCALVVVYYLIFYLYYLNEKARSHRGELLINKNGILDTSDEGVRIGLPWHFIEALVITDKIICFTSKSVAFFFITSEQADIVLKAVNTYQSDLKIIDKRMRKYVKIEEETEENVDDEEIEDNIDVEVEEAIKDLKES